MQRDDSQRSVIEAAPESRLLIGAGPGTGKTAVACRRVAHLIAHDGLEPGAIWLISFTRTAVTEIRDRIAGHLDDPEDAYAVNLATLDRYAWTIHSGFGSSEFPTSYEENIGEVLELVRSDEDVADYLQTIEHLVVDEAQDIVGPRADLVVELIRNLQPDTGVTVFADEAQAIYGFADEREARADDEREPPLSGDIRAGRAGAFAETELATVHRTSSPTLKRLFSTSRKRLLDHAVPAAERYQTIREDVRTLSDGTAPPAGKGFPARDDLLVLYRRRSEVLLASSFLAGNGTPHRLRMSGLPERIAPWIGATLAEADSPRLGRRDFMARWADRVEGTALASCDAARAWEQLWRLAGAAADAVDMPLLRRKLGRGRPPPNVSLPDLGDSGPVIGTIHASKGREADRVHLMLPSSPRDGADFGAEARVVFVGATRGRSALLVGEGYGGYASDTKAGRVYRLRTAKGEPKAQVEIGREGDLGAEGVAGRRFHADPEAVRRNQIRLADFASGIHPVKATADRDNGFAYRLTLPEDEQCIAVLSTFVNNELFVVADQVRRALKQRRKRRPPDWIPPHLAVRGLRSIVLPPDSPESGTLHEPWRTTGIVLAPVVIGYATVYFPVRKY